MDDNLEVIRSEFIMSGMRTLKLSVPRAKHPLHPHDVITCPWWFRQHGAQKGRGAAAVVMVVSGLQQRGGGKEAPRKAPKKLLRRLPQQLKFRA